MARQHHIVGENHIIADNAVMRDMGIGQKSAAVADFGDHTAALGARIHGHPLADQAIGTDLERGWLAVEFQILRLVTDRGKGKHFCARADGGASGNNGMTEQFHTITQDSMRSDRAKRTDSHIGTQLRGGIDNRKGMDCAHLFYSKTSMALTSASHTVTPATLAVPRYHHILARCLSFFIWNSTVSPGSTGLRNLALSMVMK